MKKFLTVIILLLQATALYGEMIYTWKDGRGTVFYTNSLHEIPARYLRKARVLDVATGKKGGLAIEQSVVQNAPAATAQGQVQPPPPSNALPVAASVSPAVPIASPPAPASDRPVADFSRPAAPAATVTAPALQPGQTLGQRRAQRRLSRLRGQQ